MPPRRMHLGPPKAGRFTDIWGAKVSHAEIKNVVITHLVPRVRKKPSPRTIAFVNILVNEFKKADAAGVQGIPRQQILATLVRKTKIPRLDAGTLLKKLEQCGVLSIGDTQGHRTVKFNEETLFKEPDDF